MSTAPVPLSAGRQLFVDDHLVGGTDCVRTWHRAQVHPASPVLVPETEVERNGGLCPCACPFNDGVWYDPQDGLFKLWYHAGWFDGVALAISRDGIRWERPDFGIVPGTNLVLRPSHACRDGCLVWLDGSSPDPAQRFKMFLYVRHVLSGAESGIAPGVRLASAGSSALYTSPDGIHWRLLRLTPACGDNTSFFHDPFRNRFVMSLRAGWKTRKRQYFAAPTFAEAGGWLADQPVPWLEADDRDLPDPDIGYRPQLYDFNAVAYESLMLGMFAIFYGPENHICERTGQVKTIDLHLGFSRDGFTWSRPEPRRPFLACSRRPGAWDYGYLHAAGGLCCVVGDELRFYFGAFSGDSTLRPGESGPSPSQYRMYAGGSTGLAVLRRDGFASLGAGAGGGTLSTPLVTFTGTRLFVNAAAAGGELRVAILDHEGRVIAPFSHADCLPLRADATRQQVAWRGGADLAALAGTPVRFVFAMQRAELYAFWVSPDAGGASLGHVAAGGPGYPGPIDTVGGPVA